MVSEDARREGVEAAAGKVVILPAEFLYEEGFVGPYKVAEAEGGKKEIQLTIRYTAEKEPIISEMNRISRPGRRVYRGCREIKPVRNGIGVALLSTPKGILTDRQAREEKVGGELLFTIW